MKKRIKKVKDIVTTRGEAFHRVLTLGYNDELLDIELVEINSLKNWIKRPEYIGPDAYWREKVKESL